MKNFLKPVFAAAVVLSLPVVASAAVVPLTVTVTDLATATTLTFVDDGSVGGDTAFDGILTIGATTVGGSTVAITSSVASQAPGESTLSLNANSAISGSGGLTISATWGGFGEGADSPNPSNVTYGLGASNIGADITGEGWVDATSVGGPLSVAGVANASAGIAAVLTNPFALTSTVTVAANSTANFTSTVVAAVPIPASGLLLLGGLGGLVAMRRRRRKA